MYATLLGSETIVTVTQGMCEVSETTENITVFEALKIANDFNTCKLHPDAYVMITYEGKELNQIVSGVKIVGFVEPEPKDVLRTKIERLITYVEVELEAPNTEDTDVNTSKEWNIGYAQSWNDAFKDILAKLKFTLK